MSQDNRGGLSAGRADAAEHLVLGWKFKNGTSPLLECVPPPEQVSFKVRTACTPPAVVPSCSGPRNRDPREERGGGALTSERIHQSVTVESP